MKFLILFFTFWGCQHLYCQSMEIEYIYQKQGSTSNDSNVPEELLEIRKERASKKTSFTLQQANNQSEFKISPSIKQQDNGISELRTSYEGDVYYKDFDSKIILGKATYLFDSYSIKDQLNNFDWQLHADFEYILGYKCYKATMYDCEEDTEIVAWYTPAIPVPNGPLHIGGLPGLILKLAFYDGKTTFVAQNIDLLDGVCFDIEIPKSKKTINLTDFCNKKMEIYNGLYQRAVNESK